MFHNPPHPGSVIEDEILIPLGLSVPEAANRMGVSHDALSGVILREARINANLALALEKSGYGSARSWIKMQENRDIWDQNNPENSLSSTP